VPAVAWLVPSLVASLAAPAFAQPVSAPGTGAIYSCIDDRGRRLTSDRPIPECAGREQELRARDGSVRRVVPPLLSPEQQAEAEARERRAAAQRAAHADAVRRDRSLLQRFPDEAAHRRAREAALDTVRLAMRSTEQRLQDLANERRPLETEREFYVGRELPPELRRRINANDAALAAQREATAQQQAEIARINGLFDVELERLQRLWAGAAPGSMGPLPAAGTAAGTAAGPAVASRAAGTATAAGTHPAAPHPAPTNPAAAPKP
jgi:hypothetical protein